MAEISEERVKEVLANYTSIRKGKGSRYLKPQQDPEFPGWSAIAVTKYQTLKKQIGFPLTIQKMTEACDRIDASGKNLKRFYDDLHMFLALMEEQAESKVIEGFSALRETVLDRYNTRRDEDDKKVRKLSKQQEEAWLEWPEVMFRTHMSILHATVIEGSLEQSYDHLSTEELEQYFICAFHVLEALPRRHEELSYLEWKIDEEEPRCNYIEDLDTGKIVINRHKTSGYDPSCFSSVRMSLTTCLPLLRELRKRATPDSKYVLPDYYRSSRRTAKYTAALYLATGRYISMNTLRHICATALTKSNYNTRRNADKFISYHMGHTVKTQSKYYVNQEIVEDRHPKREIDDEESDISSADDIDEENNDVMTPEEQVIATIEKDNSTTDEDQVIATIEKDNNTTDEDQVITTNEKQQTVKSTDGGESIRDNPEGVKSNKRSRYLPTTIEVATLVQLGSKWKPKLMQGERMSIQSLLSDSEIILVNGQTAAQNLCTFGGVELAEHQRIEKLRNYVRTSDAFQPDKKLQHLKDRVRAAAAKQRR